MEGPEVERKLNNSKNYRFLNFTLFSFEESMEKNGNKTRADYLSQTQI